MSSVKLVVALMAVATTYASTVKIEFVGADASVSFAGLVPAGNNATLVVKDQGKSTTDSDVTTAILVIASLGLFMYGLNIVTKRRARSTYGRRVGPSGSSLRAPDSKDLRFASVPSESNVM